MYYLVTTPVSRQYDGMWEVEWALKGDLKIKKTPFRGVFLVITEEDALKLIKEYETTAICRVIPLEIIARTEENEIIEKALLLSREKINEKETFAVRCKNRGERLDSRKLERDLGEKILNLIKTAEVNLTIPKKTVRIEVFGKDTGISILEEKDVLKKEAVE